MDGSPTSLAQREGQGFPPAFSYQIKSVADRCSSLQAIPSQEKAQYEYSASCSRHHPGDAGTESNMETLLRRQRASPKAARNADQVEYKKSDDLVNLTVPAPRSQTPQPQLGAAVAC
eukprot:scaffold449_cov241-Pinguiococcus_pyrenoidosus.AAC.15